MNLLIVLLIAVLFALWNGLLIKWKLSGGNVTLQMWHGIGFVIRVLPLYFIYDNLLYVLLYVNFAWTAYDMIINITNGWDVFYIGKTSVFDKLFGRLLYLCKAILLLFTIYYLAT